MQIMARQIKPSGHKRVCDFDGEGHNRIIHESKIAYQVVEGEAQGLYHGPQCYGAALKKYRALKKQVGLQQEPEYDVEVSK